MNLLSELYLLLDLAEEESSVGIIGGMISHSSQYEKASDNVSAALMSYETIIQLMHTHKIYNIDELKIAFAKLKALEIIKEKRVNVDLLHVCRSLEEYNMEILPFGSTSLTQEEYELLKGVLLC